MSLGAFSSSLARGAILLEDADLAAARPEPQRVSATDARRLGLLVPDGILVRLRLAQLDRNGRVHDGGVHVDLPLTHD